VRWTQRAIESQLSENKLTGLSWCLIDYDDVNAKGRVGFWNLSHKQTFFGNADQLVGFQLMPLEQAPVKALQAKWTHKVVDMSRRFVAFTDQSVGQVTAWKWEFGDGTTSAEQHPQHVYSRAGDFVVTLEVSGPEGTSRFQRVWDVSLR
jgi:PKD repeat protein